MEIFRTHTRITSQTKDFIRCTHHGLVHTPIPLPKAMKIPAAKASVDTQWEQLNNLPTGANQKFVPKQTSHMKLQTKRLQYTPQHTKEWVPLETHRGGRASAKVQRTSRSSRRQRQRCRAVFVEQGASASRMTAATVPDTLSLSTSNGWRCKRHSLSLYTCQNEGRSHIAEASAQWFPSEALRTATCWQEYCGTVSWKN